MLGNALAALCHFAWFLGFPVLGPLFLWLFFGRYAQVHAQANEALNFQISLLIFEGIMALLYHCAPFLQPVWLSCGFIVALAAVILTIIACVTVLSGKPYRYPYIIRLIP